MNYDPYLKRLRERDFDHTYQNSAYYISSIPASSYLTYEMDVERTYLPYYVRTSHIHASSPISDTVMPWQRCFACINLPIYTPNCAKMGVSCKFHQREEPAISTVINHLLAAGAKKGHPLRLKVELMSIAAKTNSSKATINDQNYLHS